MFRAAARLHETLAGEPIIRAQVRHPQLAELELTGVGNVHLPNTPVGELDPLLVVRTARDQLRLGAERIVRTPSTRPGNAPASTAGGSVCGAAPPCDAPGRTRIRARASRITARAARCDRAPRPRVGQLPQQRIAEHDADRAPHDPADA